MAGKAPDMAIVGSRIKRRPEKTVMKTILLIVCAVLFCLPAFAAKQYNTSAMSCSQVQSALKRDGRAQLRYPSPRDPTLTLYDNYVGDSSNCNSGVTKPAYVPAKDTRKCKVNQCRRPPGR